MKHGWQPVTSKVAARDVVASTTPTTVAIGAEPHLGNKTLKDLTGTDAQLVQDVVNYILKNTNIIVTDLMQVARH